MKRFAELFKKYRLRSEFETISSFSSVLAEKGYHYEESIFSHWQKGTRIPNNRELVLTLIRIFIGKEAITTVNAANEFLASAGFGYLTDNEMQEFNLKNFIHSHFQVPSDIVHFTGRREIIAKIQKAISHQNVFFLHGPAGVGKTALAIKLGHLLRNKFSDGVLWYKVDSSNVMDILLSIANLFGEDIGSIRDIEVRASIVRTLLENKKVLIIFDNVNSRDNLHLLLPNSSSCCVVFSSQEKIFDTDTHHSVINLRTFTNSEVLELFGSVFKKSIVTKYKKTILKIAEKLGNLPLALHIAAHVIATYPKKSLAFEAYLEQLEGDSLDLQTLTYEDKNLFRAINIGFETLDNRTKNVFISLGVFEGKDFSPGAVGFINKLSLNEAKSVLSKLHSISFVEGSDVGRNRIHPLMKIFARKQMSDSSLYLRAAFYYEQVLTKAEEKHSYKTLMREIDNIVYIFKKCYDAGYWDQIITLWNPIEKLLSETNEIKKLRHLAQTIDTAPSINNLQKILTVYMVFILVYWAILFFSGLKTSFWNYFYGLLWTIIPFVGGLVGILKSRSWGFFQTNIGKALFFISAGLFCWAISGPVWFFYNIWLKIDVPYPSLIDTLFFSLGVFWIIGIIYLSKATGAKFSLRRMQSKLFMLFIPIIVIAIISYFLLFAIKRTFASENPLKIFLDLAYPIMDTIILSIAVIILGLSVNFFRGKYRLSIFVILGGFVFEFIGDLVYSYTTTFGMYYNGSVFELLFTIAVYLVTMGTLSFYLTPKKV